MVVNTQSFDVIIIGGSYAGLSAAMALGRSLRNVLVIDAGKPCNAQTPHSHNFITQDGETPAAITAKAKEQVLAYPTVRFFEGYATSAMRMESGFEIVAEGGQTFSGSKLIFATGVKDLLPEIEGFAACWGITAVHCPYCHGYEIRNVKTGILANGDAAFDTAKLISNWTKSLTVLTNGESTLSKEQVRELEGHSIQVEVALIEGIEHTNGHIESLKLDNGVTLELDALYARVPFEQHSALPNVLGVEVNEHGYLPVDLFQKTSVDGVYACGDNTTFLRSVAQAVYAGSVAGAGVNMELIREGWGG